MQIGLELSNSYGLGISKPRVLLNNSMIFLANRAFHNQDAVRRKCLDHYDVVVQVANNSTSVEGCVLKAIAAALRGLQRIRSICGELRLLLVAFKVRIE